MRTFECCTPCDETSCIFLKLRGITVYGAGLCTFDLLDKFGWCYMDEDVKSIFDVVAGYLIDKKEILDYHLMR